MFDYDLGKFDYVYFSIHRKATRYNIMFCTLIDEQYQVILGTKTY